MRLSPRVSEKPMKRLIAMSLFLSGTAMTVGCGQVLSEDGRSCPCATGWTCCPGSSVCVEEGASCDSTESCGPKNEIDLGTETIGGDASASMIETVTGQAKGLLAGGAPVPFDYSMSIWPQANNGVPGFAFSGWLVPAQAGQSFTFKLWAEPGDGGPTMDAGSLPVPLVVYGPLSGVGTASCVTTTTSDSGVMQGGVATWMAPQDGTYFAVPYHDVFFTETDAGLALAFQNFESPLYANAFIEMQPGE
jgi:hypothetical protein